EDVSRHDGVERRARTIETPEVAAGCLVLRRAVRVVEVPVEQPLVPLVAMPVVHGDGIGQVAVFPEVIAEPPRRVIGEFRARVRDDAGARAPLVTADELTVLVVGAAAVLRELSAHREMPRNGALAADYGTGDGIVDADVERQQAVLVGSGQTLRP